MLIFLLYLMQFSIITLKIKNHNIISEIRIPRDLGAILVGMALAVAGAVIQGVTKNGLADPSLID